MNAPFERILANNKKARRDYHIHETFEAGLALKGTEVKAVRNGKIQLKDSHVEFKNNEAFLVGAHIGPYSHGNRENHEPERPRKLLLSRRQIDKLFGRTLVKGMTVIPLKVYIKGNWIKAEIGLAQGKKLHDKRETEKKREQEKEMREAMRGGPRR